MADAALVGGEARHDAARAIEAAGVAGLEHRLLGADIVAAQIIGQLLIQPDDVEMFEQGPVEGVDPDDRVCPVVAMVVPCAVGGQHEIAARRLAALPLHIGVAAVVGEDGAAGVGAVQMGAGDIAGVVDRHRAADGRGHLQAPAKAGIGEKELLAVGEFHGGHVRLGGDAGDLVEIGGNFAPFPVVRNRLHLPGAHAPLRHLPGGASLRVAEPRALGRRVGLRAQPDRQAASLRVQGLHARAGVGVEGRMGGLLGVGHGISVLRARWARSRGWACRRARR